MDPVACMNEAIARFRRAEPDVSVMIMTPPGLGRARHEQDARVAEEVRGSAGAVGQESHAAFFDFRSAMGGEGSMARFLELGLTQGEGVLFNARGGAIVGGRVVAALSRAFDAWAERHPRAGCE